MSETKLLIPETSVAWDHNPGLPTVAFWTVVAERDYREMEAFHWPTDAKEFRTPDGTEILARLVRHGGVEAVLDFGEAIARVQIESGNVWGTVAGASLEEVARVCALAEEAWPRSVAAEDEVPVTFWSYTANGPRSITRRISVPPWAAVESNYGGQAHGALHRMMTSFRPSHGGQLILWQGIPGTGKTWALRALASEWREWAEFHYITDPEIFFGSKADYMLDVLLDETDDYPVATVGEHVEDELPLGGRWRVLLLEDTGEILAADAKEKTGQALSRLLNVVDGLIGQGLRILVLVTTNEELKKLHPAVSRPGRCAARIEFGQLAAEEARAWLKEQAVRPTALSVGKYSGGGATLAELYALLENREAHDEVPVGFVQG